MDSWPKMEPHSVDYSYEEDLQEFYPNYEGPFRGYEQSVTLHAQMETGGGDNRGNSEDPGTEVGWFLWGITAEQLPILIGAAAGGLVLIMTMLGLLIWRCCTNGYDNEKSYYIQSSDDIEDKQARRNVMQSCSESIVYLNSKPGAPTFQSCLVEKIPEVDAGANNNGITRSQSAPVKDEVQNGKFMSPQKRPLSQPLQFSPSDASFAPGQQIMQGMPHLTFVHLPDIPEMALRSCEGLEQYSQYASSSVLDEVNNKMYPHIDLSEAAMKTRSLPAWVRARPRPLSTEDDLNELYAKVNFSKKRKNRMRNDSAAAIALNKSRSQFIPFPFMHKDTDSLVDNEAVVIYDERTAL